MLSQYTKLDTRLEIKPDFSQIKFSGPILIIEAELSFEAFVLEQGLEYDSLLKNVKTIKDFLSDRNK